MNMVIPDEGKLLWLTWAITGDPPTVEDFTVKLYQNNYTPVDTSTASNFTEATFTGYAAVSVLRSSMGAPALTGHVAYSVRSTAPSFTCTGGASQVIYGWYMIGATSGKVLAAALFDNPRTMSNGATEQLSPFQFGLQTLH